MPNAVRIADWGHMCGNMMKYSSDKCIPNWPVLLRGLRGLVRFLRDRAWRMHLKNAVEKRGLPNEAKKLSSFTPNFVKWRYETLHDVFEKLLELQLVCTTILVCLEEIFPGMEDRELVKDVVTACKWQELWVFMAVFFRLVLRPLEKLRRWGLTCRCCMEAST